MVMACVFDPLLPGVCLHASCHTLFLCPVVLFCCLLLISFQNYFIISIIICFLGYSIYIVKEEHVQNNDNGSKNEIFRLLFKLYQS